ncbi:MAG: hypothetical protein HQK83_19705 [Fibrobacteria bacterium]|nr:hypothetical protein [Fibrobacteria bacterium]
MTSVQKLKRWGAEPELTIPRSPLAQTWQRTINTFSNYHGIQQEWSVSDFPLR